jgi:hypothetical protein
MRRVVDPKTAAGSSSTGAAVPKRHRETKSGQCSKIREIGKALRAEGLISLDQQATALGLSRSTAWTILRGDHKSSGLSANVIRRMLAVPKLPPQVRRKILEYVAEKSAGRYGHSEKQLRRFAAKLSPGPRRFR